MSGHQYGWAQAKNEEISNIDDNIRGQNLRLVINQASAEHTGLTFFGLIY
jgi:hypothetical protein